MPPPGMLPYYTMPGGPGSDAYPKDSNYKQKEDVRSLSSDSETDINHPSKIAPPGSHATAATSNFPQFPLID